MSVKHKEIEELVNQGFKKQKQNRENEQLEAHQLRKKNKKRLLIFRSLVAINVISLVVAVAAFTMFVPSSDLYDQSGNLLWRNVLLLLIGSGATEGEVAGANSAANKSRTKILFTNDHQNSDIYLWQQKNDNLKVLRYFNATDYDQLVEFQLTNVTLPVNSQLSFIPDQGSLFYIATKDYGFGVYKQQLRSGNLERINSRFFPKSVAQLDGQVYILEYESVANRYIIFSIDNDLQKKQLYTFESNENFFMQNLDEYLYVANQALNECYRYTTENQLIESDCLDLQLNSSKLEDQLVIETTYIANNQDVQNSQMREDTQNSVAATDRDLDFYQEIYLKTDIDAAKTQLIEKSEEDGQTEQLTGNNLLSTSAMSISELVSTTGLSAVFKGDRNNRIYPISLNSRGQIDYLNLWQYDPIAGYQQIVTVNLTTGSSKSIDLEPSTSREIITTLDSPELYLFKDFSEDEDEVLLQGLNPEIEGFVYFNLPECDLKSDFCEIGSVD